MCEREKKREEWEVTNLIQITSLGTHHSWSSSPSHFHFCGIFLLSSTFFFSLSLSVFSSFSPFFSLTKILHLKSWFLSKMEENRKKGRKNDTFCDISFPFIFVASFFLPLLFLFFHSLSLLIFNPFSTSKKKYRVIWNQLEETTLHFLLPSNPSFFFLFLSILQLKN